MGRSEQIVFCVSLLLFAVALVATSITAALPESVAPAYYVGGVMIVYAVSVGLFMTSKPVLATTERISQWVTDTKNSLEG
jgi:hypothetical protein